ncbi:protein import receptor MAS20 [Ascobolus immersus RN42]|uniref:Mitochondrial import receptor subunit TOM20 n=1 Tax=Ascobolus immersus RN42 TaxID=1160509 RepID=A0A3N4IQG8_ASCIM|nr:protein import receptor MAS20 [Ascobolus immersus RN42]
MKTSTVVITGAASLLAIGCDAVYFDYKRRHDVEFRKALKKEKKRAAKAEKEQAQAGMAAQKARIRELVDEAKAEGFPSDVEERETFFMNEVARGEGLCQEGMEVPEGQEKVVDAALCFYKALKVYPQPKDLISIYDKTVPKPVLDILAEMIAKDSSINLDGMATEASHGVE